MRTRQNRLAGLVAMVGILVMGPGSAWAVVDGVVLDDAFTAVADATVEFWDSYPGGTVLATTMTAADGSYSLDPGAGVTDGVIRAYKNRMFPSVTRNVANPSPAAASALSPWGWNPAENQTSTNCDFWDMSSEFLGAPLQQGDVISMFDRQGVLCGMAFLTDLAAEYQEGGYVVHVTGDDGTTPVTDEGASNGDTLSVRINNLPAVPLDSALVWYDQFFFKRPIGTIVPDDHQGVRVTGPPAVGGVAGTPVMLIFDVRNTGTVTDGFNLTPYSPDGWIVSIVGNSTITGLEADSTTQVSVLVNVPTLSELTPADLAVELHDVFLSAASQTNDVVIGLGRGTISLESTDVGGTGGTLPTSYSLSQNYPNPFNPSTVIEFALARPTNIRLAVFNILGRELTTLAEGMHEPGRHVVVFNANAAGVSTASGVYFYRLELPTEAVTRKMVLMK